MKNVNAFHNEIGHYLFMMYYTTFLKIVFMMINLCDCLKHLHNKKLKLNFFHENIRIVDKFQKKSKTLSSGAIL